ncbi:hypothetical protein SAY87_027834 [Trapa incisa]|uniref:Uncharacterized protein n=1 Tax=Trapa incisa TaxID=236973 RepID=A0AAN7JNK3_9MYRT|nr:hypothetical protein SAY87_027834 [Trapa incisa]
MLTQLSMTEVDAGVALAQQNSRPWASSPPYHGQPHNGVLYKSCEANKEWISGEGRQSRSMYHYNVHALRSRRRPYPPLHPQNSWSTRHHHQHIPRTAVFNHHNADGGGPGMQALFINWCPRPSSGTGVFLPQSPDVYNLESSNKKQDVKRKGLSRDDHSNEGMDSENNASQCCVLSQNRSFSPHIFLPKEWTY